MSTNGAATGGGFALFLAAGVLAHSASGQFGGLTLSWDAEVVRNSASGAVGDVDNDGDVDIVVYSLSQFDPPNDRLNVFLGDGSGANWTPLPPVALSASGVRFLHLGDFNNDGLLDVFYAQLASGLNSVNVHLGLGDGTFGPAVVTAGLAGRLALADFNSDGLLDVVVLAGASNSEVSFLFGVGDGTFTTQPVDLGGIPTDVQVDDFDGDGAIDAAFVLQQDSACTVLFGDGAGGFPAQRTFFFPNDATPSFLLKGDIDGDGDQDLLEYNGFSGGTIHTIINEGDRSFTTFAAQALNESAFLLAALGDLDGDNRADLVYAKRGLFSLADLVVRLGAGDGTFLPKAQQLPLSFNPAQLTITDMNGDDAPDALYVDFDLVRGTAVLLNQTPIAAPGAFALTSPPDGSTGLSLPKQLAGWPSGEGEALVQWEPALGFAVRYTLTVAEDAALSQVVLQQGGLAKPRFVLPQGLLRPGRTYFWSVAATNSAGQTPALAGPFSFSTRFSADIDGDGVVGPGDLFLLLGSWGQPQP